jgi:hypothetical protein
LPTAETPAAAVVEDGERDDELARLQRLLGMTQQAAEVEPEAADEPVKEATADQSAEEGAAADGEAEKD